MKNPSAHNHAYEKIAQYSSPLLDDNARRGVSKPDALLHTHIELPKFLEPVQVHGHVGAIRFEVQAHCFVYGIINNNPDADQSDLEPERTGRFYDSDAGNRTFASLSSELRPNTGNLFCNRRVGSFARVF